MFASCVVPLESLQYELPTHTSFHPMFLYPAGMIRIENHLDTYYCERPDVVRDDLNTAIRQGLTREDINTLYAIVLTDAEEPVYGAVNLSMADAPVEECNVLIINLSEKDTSDLAHSSQTNEAANP